MKIKIFTKISIVYMMALFHYMSPLQELYPFKKNPKLSWSQFEKNLRETYKHLDIPPIVLTNLKPVLQSSPARYMADDEPFVNEVLSHDEEFEAMLKECFEETKDDKLVESLRVFKGVQAPFLVINPECNYFLSWQEAAYVILHETGHHYYHKSGLHKKNHDAAYIAANILSAASLLGTALYNAQFLAKKTWSGKALLAQGLFALLYSTSTIHNVVRDVQAVRSEEFIADDFANQHATKEILLAGRYLCTVDHYAETIGEKYPDISRAFQNPENDNDKLTVKIMTFLVSAASVLEYSHPSHDIRYKLADKALKERFGQE